jgi:hypothetical protein
MVIFAWRSSLLRLFILKARLFIHLTGPATISHHPSPYSVTLFVVASSPGLLSRLAGWSAPVIIMLALLVLGHWSLIAVCLISKSLHENAVPSLYGVQAEPSDHGQYYPVLDARLDQIRQFPGALDCPSI